MPRPLSDMLEEVSRSHFPYPPATPEDDDRWGPASVYALCYVQDGDYVVVDAGHPENGRYPLIDGWHEAWPDPKQCSQIASCFAEFLEGALRSKGRQFWLKRS